MKNTLYKSYSNLLRVGLLSKDDLLRHVEEGRLSIDMYKLLVSEECPISLEALKQLKSKQISESCKLAIEDGFYSSVHYGEPKLFGFDKDDQDNYMQGLYLIDKGIYSSTIPCKAKGEVYEYFTVEDFKQLAEVEAHQHKMTNLIKCDMLKTQIKAAVSIEELNNIEW